MAKRLESKQKLHPPAEPHQAKSDGSILVQLLEFKTRLLEAVEELHIRRALQLSKCCSLGGEVKKQKDVMMAPDIPEQDAEAHFEDQISKLVLEKQGLEWEKDSQRHQIETAANQHSESLINVKKQFQAKIRNIEEEKGKYQVSVELKDKEINSLKEELKSLQLLKYNLEKKSSELEQKLALQSRLKDTHLNQLGEVEKRFSALSRQCAMVKQAHEKLEQNVDEAMKINKKITSANEEQEAIITSLNKEIEELSNKLIKIKMSSVRHEKPSSPTAWQQIQQLHHKLNMETEMNTKLRDENVALQSEKQEVMRSLLLTQQLLLSQTQTVNGVELELQTQREKYQALKQEHEVMREKSKAVEEEMVQLKESYTVSTVALKETTTLLDQMKSDQQDFVAVKEAYDELQKKHMELLTQAKVNVSEQEMPESSEKLSVSPSSGERPPDEPSSDSTLPSCNSLQRSSQTKNSDCMKDTDAGTKRVATGSLGEQGASTLTPQSQCTEPPDSNPFACLHSVSAMTNVEKCRSSQNMSVDAADVRSDLISANSTVSDVHLQFTGKNSCTRNVTNLEDEEKKKQVNKEVSKAEHGGNYDEDEGKNNREEEKRKEDNEEQQQNGEVIQTKDAEKKEWSENRGALMVQTANRKDRQESAEDSADNRKPETEKTERRDEEEEGGKAPETEIQAQTTGDKNHRDGKRSDTPQVSDFTSNTQPPETAFKPPDCSQSLSQKVTEEKLNSGQLLHSLNSDGSQVLTCGSNDIIYEGQSHNGEQCDHPASFQECGKNSAGTRESTADFPVELGEPLNQSNMCRSQSDQLDGVSIQEIITAQTQVCSSNITGDMKLTDKTCDADVAEEGGLVQNTSEPLTSPPNEEKPEQENGDLAPVVTRTNDGLSQINICEMDAPVSEPVEKPNITDKQLDCFDVKVNIEDTETDSCQRHLKNVTEDTESAPSESDSKPKSPEVVGSRRQEMPPPKEMYVGDISGLSLPSNKTYRSAFESGSAQRRTAKANAPAQDGFLQVPGQETHRSLQSGHGGVTGCHLNTLPKFLKGKHHKVPLVITTATDLLNPSSVCGTAASSRRHQQGEWKAIGETCGETAAAGTENTVSGCVSNSSRSSRLSTQTSPGFSRTMTPSVGPNPESEQGPSCSQDTEDQQSSFRAQISKIEQFLNTERLRLPKRRKTDN